MDERQRREEAKKIVKAVVGNLGIGFGAADTFAELISLLDEYIKGNAEEIGDLERSIKTIEGQLLEQLPKNDPTALLEYLARVVELKLNMEELKVRKGTSLANLLRGWAPILVPLLVAGMTLIGVAIGTKVEEGRGVASKTQQQERYEEQLILNALRAESREDKSQYLEALVESGLITHHEEEVGLLLSKLKKEKQ